MGLGLSCLLTAALRIEEHYIENHFRITVQLRVSMCEYLVSAAMIAAGMLAVSESIAQVPTAPPVAPVQVVTENYFGTEVSDPYRYMENLKDLEVMEWFTEQDAYTRLALSRIPGRVALLARIKQLDQSGPPRVFDGQRFQNEKYFYQKRLPDDEIAKLYERSGLQGSEKVLVDPDKYVSKPGTLHAELLPAVAGRTLRRLRSLPVRFRGWGDSRP
jgi:Prolyl oligopeptidase, N-terminal beta-propeller domain